MFAVTSPASDMPDINLPSFEEISLSPSQDRPPTSMSVSDMVSITESVDELVEDDG